MRCVHRFLLGGLISCFALVSGCDSASQTGADLAAPDLAVTGIDLAGPAADLALPAGCNGSVPSVSSPGPTPPAAPAFTVASDLQLETIAKVGGARELAALPNGDLVVGTTGNSVYLVPDAEAAGAAGAPVLFTSINDAPVQGVAFEGSSCTLFIASQHGIYSTAYADGMTSAPAGAPIAKVRQGGISGTDGDTHTTTSIVSAGATLYAGVGSSCNACSESDPTRATIQQMDPTGANLTTRGTRMRNAIALAVNPTTGTLWAGGAGQDGLALGHPYEYFDAVGLHAGVADYGWPLCEENQVAYTAGTDCSQTVAPLIELPAYSTLIGAVFYPASPSGAYALPARYHGVLFITAHGSWHKTNGTYFSPPRIVMVEMNGDAPKTPVDWSDPSKQWTEVIGGFQLADNITRIGRPTGIAIGSKGSLFFADDQNGLVYRVRPK